MAGAGVLATAAAATWVLDPVGARGFLGAVGRLDDVLVSNPALWPVLRAGAVAALGPHIGLAVAVVGYAGVAVAVAVAWWRQWRRVRAAPTETDARAASGAARSWRGAALAVAGYALLVPRLKDYGYVLLLPLLTSAVAAHPRRAPWLVAVSAIGYVGLHPAGLALVVGKELPGRDLLSFLPTVLLPLLAWWAIHDGLPAPASGGAVAPEDPDASYSKRAAFPPSESTPEDRPWRRSASSPPTRSPR
jgi:hypothetical protein